MNPSTIEFFRPPNPSKNGDFFERMAPHFLLPLEQNYHAAEVDIHLLNPHWLKKYGCLNSCSKAGALSPWMTVHSPNLRCVVWHDSSCWASISRLVKLNNGRGWPNFCAEVSAYPKGGKMFCLHAPSQASTLFWSVWGGCLSGVGTRRSSSQITTHSENIWQWTIIDSLLSN